MARLTVRPQLSRIARYLEPYIQAMITNRIVTFHDGLVRDGVFKWVPPSPPVLDDMLKSNPGPQPVGFAPCALDERKAG